MAGKKTAARRKLCPECLKYHLVVQGRFKKHRAKRGMLCPGSGLPTKKALKPAPTRVVGGGLPTLGGRY